MEFNEEEAFNKALLEGIRNGYVRVEESGNYTDNRPGGMDWINDRFAELKTEHYSKRATDVQQALSKGVVRDKDTKQWVLASGDVDRAASLQRDESIERKIQQFSTWYAGQEEKMDNYTLTDAREQHISELAEQDAVRAGWLVKTGEDTYDEAKPGGWDYYEKQYAHMIRGDAVMRKRLAKATKMGAKGAGVYIPYIKALDTVMDDPQRYINIQTEMHKAQAEGRDPELSPGDAAFYSEAEDLVRRAINAEVMLTNIATETLKKATNAYEAASLVKQQDIHKQRDKHKFAEILMVNHPDLYGPIYQDMAQVGADVEGKYGVHGGVVGVVADVANIAPRAIQTGMAASLKGVDYSKIPKITLDDYNAIGEERKQEAEREKTQYWDVYGGALKPTPMPRTGASRVAGLPYESLKDASIWEGIKGGFAGVLAGEAINIDREFDPKILKGFDPRKGDKPRNLAEVIIQGQLFYSDQARGIVAEMGITEDAKNYDEQVAQVYAKLIEEDALGPLMNHPKALQIGFEILASFGMANATLPAKLAAQKYVGGAIKHGMREVSKKSLVLREAAKHRELTRSEKIIKKTGEAVREVVDGVYFAPGYWLSAADEVELATLRHAGDVKHAQSFLDKAAKVELDDLRRHVPIETAEDAAVLMKIYEGTKVTDGDILELFHEGLMSARMTDYLTRQKKLVAAHQDEYRRIMDEFGKRSIESGVFTYVDADDIKQLGELRDNWVSHSLRKEGIMPSKISTIKSTKARDVVQRTGAEGYVEDVFAQGHHVIDRRPIAEAAWLDRTAEALKEYDKYVVAPDVGKMKWASKAVKGRTKGYNSTASKFKVARADAIQAKAIYDDVRAQLSKRASDHARKLKGVEQKLAQMLQEGADPALIRAELSKVGKARKWWETAAAGTDEAVTMALRKAKLPDVAKPRIGVPGIKAPDMRGLGGFGVKTRKAAEDAANKALAAKSLGEKLQARRVSLETARAVYNAEVNPQALQRLANIRRLENGIDPRALDGSLVKIKDYINAMRLPAGTDRKVLHRRIMEGMTDVGHKIHFDGYMDPFILDTLVHGLVKAPELHKSLQIIGSTVAAINATMRKNVTLMGGVTFPLNTAQGMVAIPHLAHGMPATATNLPVAMLATGALLTGLGKKAFLRGRIVGYTEDGVAVTLEMLAKEMDNVALTGKAGALGRMGEAGSDLHIRLETAGLKETRKMADLLNPAKVVVGLHDAYATGMAKLIEFMDTSQKLSMLLAELEGKVINRQNLLVAIDRVATKGGGYHRIGRWGETVGRYGINFIGWQKQQMLLLMEGIYKRPDRVMLAQRLVDYHNLSTTSGEFRGDESLPQYLRGGLRIENDALDEMAAAFGLGDRWFTKTVLPELGVDEDIWGTSDIYAIPQDMLGTLRGYTGTEADFSMMFSAATNLAIMVIGAKYDVPGTPDLPVVSIDPEFMQIVEDIADNKNFKNTATYFLESLGDRGRSQTMEWLKTVYTPAIFRKLAQRGIFRDDSNLTMDQRRQRQKSRIPGLYMSERHKELNRQLGLGLEEVKEPQAVGYE